MDPVIGILSGELSGCKREPTSTPVLRARSMASFTDNRPRSAFSSASFFVGLPPGTASSKVSKLSNPIPPVTRGPVAAFLASARLSAMASLMLRGILGVGISSSGGTRRIGLEGDFGIDFVRTRGVEGVATALADGLDGDGAREREVGGTDFGIDFVRTRGIEGAAAALADGLDGDGAREREVGGTNAVLTVGLDGGTRRDMAQSATCKRYNACVRTSRKKRRKTKL